MTAANFTRPGAIDLSSLANSAATPAAASATPLPAGSGYVVDVTEATFDALADLSMQHPVVLEMTMAAAPETQSVDRTLVELANASQGRWLLARVDVSTQPRIAQAMGVQAVPTVIALIGGQVAPLFQGTRDRADIVALLDEVVKLAIANGITGRARPVSGTEPQPAGNGAAEAGDPRFAAADDALAAGDFVRALAEFEKLIKANPRDTEAAAGKAQVGLLLRTEGLDEATALATAAAAPDDLAAQLTAADVEVMTGRAGEGFARLIHVIRNATGADRDTVRVRLVELLSTLEPTDPLVLKARRDLSSALY